jgi:linoleate 10R-lipoxygenase
MIQSLARGCSRSLSTYVSAFFQIACYLSSQWFHLVYKDLPHPPSSYLALPPSSNPIVNANQPGGATRPYPVNYAFRAADGSNYNPFMPTIGMAGSPYARTVPSLRRMSPTALPPAELVFDKLLKRDKFVEHPGGISSLFFGFADLVIHNIFNTDFQSPGYTINKSSSYLDLSPLYGTSQKVVDHVRLHDGTGRLKPDVFADPRLLNMPPTVCALLVIFNRNHNVSRPATLDLRRASSSLSFQVRGGKNPLHQRVWEVQVSSAPRSNCS